MQRLLREPFVFIPLAQLQAALANKNLYFPQILSALAVELVTVYRQHKIPLFAGNLYVSPYTCSTPV